jgi:hypothetical protein
MGLLVVITCGGDKRVWMVYLGHTSARKIECELSIVVVFVPEIPSIGNVTT